MKSKNWIYLFLPILFGCFTVATSAQKNDIKSFKEFVDLLEKKDTDNNFQISNSLYLQFINDTPYVDIESANSFKVLIKRENFVGILLNSTYDSGRTLEVVLNTYDWNGNQIAEFDFGSGIYDHYYTEAYVCRLKSGDTLECFFTFNDESQLKSKQDTNSLALDCITLLDETAEELFIISTDGNIEAIKPIEEED